MANINPTKSADDIETEVISKVLETGDMESIEISSKQRELIEQHYDCETDSDQDND